MIELLMQAVSECIQVYGRYLLAQIVLTAIVTQLGLPSKTAIFLILVVFAVTWTLMRREYKKRYGERNVLP